MPPAAQLYSSERATSLIDSIWEVFKGDDGDVRWHSPSNHPSERKGTQQTFLPVPEVGYARRIQEARCITEHY